MEYGTLLTFYRLNNDIRLMIRFIKKDFEGIREKIKKVCKPKKY